MLKRIFIDLDDVLNTFTPYVLSLVCGKKIEYADYPIECGWNIHQAAAILSGKARYNNSKNFWDEINQSVWESVPKSPEFNELITMCCSAVGKEGTFILTAPQPTVSCAAGKMQWILNNCPSWLVDNTIITTKKELLSADGSLLIDDNENNIEKFLLGRNGSFTFMVPRPWNSAWGRVIDTYTSSMRSFIYSSRCYA